MRNYFVIVFALLSMTATFAQAPEWSKDKTIYEVNIRQFTSEGTFDAFATHLPRLEKMGVGILWMMPVQPIGELNRKGSLGSYYSISDYTATNPEFGSMKEFKKVVDEAHKRDMYVILDWVANHTSWDHKWMKNHKDYYTTDKSGKIVAPVPDWSDVADLNYDNKAMRRDMIADMIFWLKEANVDGFRYDMAMMVPDDFWQEAFVELKKIKPDVFLLAEAEGPQFHSIGFTMTYAWEKHHLMKDIAQGKKLAPEMDSLIAKDLATFPVDAYRMNFTSNHDENSWQGTEFERLGEGAKAFAVMSATIPGMLLIYSGQEVALDRRLLFFEKDSIVWVDNKNYTQFYTSLVELKKENEALWNGAYGGGYRTVETGHEKVYAYMRELNGNKVMVILNLSSDAHQIKLISDAGKYKNTFTGKKQKVKTGKKMEIPAWGYVVLTQ